MGFLSKLFGRKGDEEQQKVGGMEDFMTRIRVYFQAAGIQGYTSCTHAEQ